MGNKSKHDSDKNGRVKQDTIDIKISPITRISGFMEIDIQVENHKITNAKSSGLLFRGFEKMLEGRDPLDAIYFTERICGICSTAHSMASCEALEAALKVVPSQNDVILRNIIHSFEILQNHLRHFYLYTIPDFAVTPDISPVYSQGNYDLRLPAKVSERISQNYIKAVELSKLAHSGLAVLGGKAPHNHGIFVGGVTEKADSSKIAEMKNIALKINSFVENEMLEDVHSIAEYYRDYFTMGGGYGNYMSYGMFYDIQGTDISYVRPNVQIDGKTQPLDINKITENVFSSYYSGKTIEDNLFTTETLPDLQKNDAYSFVKAPRYDGHVMEVGPLARMILSNNYPDKASTMDRTIARVYETKKISEIVLKLIESAGLNNVNQKAYEIPDAAKGIGMLDTSRGSLGHFITINNKKIEHYNIITPSAWNCSSRDSKGVFGTIEKALIGTEIQNVKHPVEASRIVRSFDPCISCATHVFCENYDPLEIII